MADKTFILEELAKPGSIIVVYGTGSEFEVNADGSISLIDTNNVISADRKDITKEFALDRLIVNRFMKFCFEEIKYAALQGIKQRRNDQENNVCDAIVETNKLFELVMTDIENSLNFTSTSGYLGSTIYNAYLNFVSQFADLETTPLASENIRTIKQKFVELVRRNWNNFLIEAFNKEGLALKLGLKARKEILGE